jgi:16S rRNA processing protein RimM
VAGLPDCASVARIRKPHGVRGEMSLEVFTDEPGAVLAPGRRVFRGTADGALWLAPEGGGPVALTVRALRPVHDGWLLTLDEVADRTEAERWNGRHLLVPVEELPAPGAHELFLHELEGMMLVDADDSREIGPVVAYYELPQGLLLEFRTATGIASIPFVEEFVVAVDRATRRIRVRPPQGLLE